MLCETPTVARTRPSACELDASEAVGDLRLPSPWRSHRAPAPSRPWHSSVRRVRVLRTLEIAAICADDDVGDDLVEPMACRHDPSPR